MVRLVIHINFLFQQILKQQCTVVFQETASELSERVDVSNYIRRERFY